MCLSVNVLVGCVVDVDGMVGPSAIALWLLYYIRRVSRTVPAYSFGILVYVVLLD